MVQEFFRQEREYEAFLKGGGYVCSGIGMGTEWHRVHKAHCPSLNFAGPARDGHRTSVRKATSRNLDDLHDWLVKTYGDGGFRYCAFCRPQEG